MRSEDVTDPTGHLAASFPGRYRLWVRGMSAAVVAGVAAYSSYGHQRVFALEAGADTVTAAIWPLSVDGLAILSSIGLLGRHPGRAERVRRLRWALRLSFLLSVVVSLAANVAAAPVLSWQAVLVAGWPPLALLLAVDLVMHGHATGNAATDAAKGSELEVGRSTIGDVSRDAPPPVEQPAADPPTPNPAASHGAQTIDQVVPQRPPARPPGVPASRSESLSAERLMWAHCERELARGRVPTGAELDRVAGTRTYGRAVLARWRREGRIPSHVEPVGSVVRGGSDAADEDGAPGKQPGVDTDGDGCAGARPVTVGGSE